MEPQIWYCAPSLGTRAVVLSLGDGGEKIYTPSVPWLAAASFVVSGLNIQPRNSLYKKMPLKDQYVLVSPSAEKKLHVIIIKAGPYLTYFLKAVFSALLTLIRVPSESYTKG